MKRFISSLICLASVFVLVSASESECRDAKSIKKFISSLSASVINNKIGFRVSDPKQIATLYYTPISSYKELAYDGLFMVKCVSLKDVEREKLNDVERNLVLNFYDVWALNKRLAGYLVVDEDFRIGFANFKGEILVEPCVGSLFCVTIDGKIIGLGNSMSSNLYNFSLGYDNVFSLGFGNLACVFNTETEQYIIAPNRYDFISVLWLDMHKKEKFQNYIVGKLQENGEMLYGVCDTNGEEIKPCIYKGIFCKSLISPIEYDCSLTETQAGLIEKRKARAEMLQRQEKERLARQQEWENFTQSLANSVGNAIGAIYDAATGTTSSSSSYSSSTTNSSSKATSSTSSSSGNDGNLLQRDRQTYRDWENQIRRMGTGLDPYNASTLQRAQSAMKNIRTKWEAKGERMYHSEWEDWK